MYLKGLGQLHCWKQCSTPRKHMQHGCPAQRIRSQVLQNTAHTPIVLIQKGTGRKTILPAQQKRYSLQGAAETVICAESPSLSVSQQHLNTEC